MHTVKVITIHTALDAVYHNMAHLGTANMQLASDISQQGSSVEGAPTPLTTWLLWAHEAALDFAR